MRAVDHALAARVQAELDEFRDPADELAQAAAVLPAVKANPTPAPQVAPAPTAPPVKADAPDAAAVEPWAAAVAVAAMKVEPAVPLPPVAAVVVPVAGPLPAAGKAGGPPKRAEPVVKEGVAAATEEAAAARGPSAARRGLAALEGAVEPLALRLGGLPVILRQTLGWVGVLTLFNAGVVWVWVLFVAPRGDVRDADPRSFLAAPEAKGEDAKGAGKGEKKDAAKDAPGAEKKAAAKKAETKKDAPGAKKDAQAKGKDAKGDKKQASAGGH